MLIKEEALRNKIKFLLEKKYFKNNDALLEIILEGKVDTAIARAETSFVSDEAKNYFEVEIKDYISGKLQDAGLMGKQHLYIPMFMSLATQGGKLKDIDTSSSDYTRHMKDLKQIMPCVLNNPNKFDMNILRSRSGSLKEFYQYVTSILGRIPNNDKCEPPIGNPGAHNTVSYQPVSFTASELRDIYASVIPNIHRKFEKKPTRTGDKTSIVYDEEGIMVVRPESQAASCYLGSRGTWCIARPKNTMYDRYEKAGDGSRHFYFVKNFDQSVKDPTGKTSDICLQFVYQPRKRYEGYWSVDDTLHMPSLNDATQSVAIVDGNNPEMIARYKKQVTTYGFDSDDYTQGIVSIVATPGLVMLVNNLRNTGLFPGENVLPPDVGKSFNVAVAVLTHLFGTKRFAGIISAKSQSGLKGGAFTGTPEEREEKRKKAAAEYKERRRIALLSAKQIISEFTLEGSEQAEELALAIEEFNDVVGTGLGKVNQANQEFKRRITDLRSMFSELDLPENIDVSFPNLETVVLLNHEDHDELSDKAIHFITRQAHFDVMRSPTSDDAEFCKLLQPIFRSDLQQDDPYDIIEDAVQPAVPIVAKFLKNISFDSYQTDFNNVIEEIEKILINAMSLTLLSPEFLVMLDNEIINEKYIQSQYYNKSPKEFKAEIPRIARNYVATHLKIVAEFLTDIIKDGVSRVNKYSLRASSSQQERDNFTCDQAIEYCKLRASLIDKIMNSSNLKTMVEEYKNKTLPGGLDKDIENAIQLVEDVTSALSKTPLGKGFKSPKTITLPRAGTSAMYGTIKVEIDVTNFENMLGNISKLIKGATSNYSEKIFLERLKVNSLERSLDALKTRYAFALKQNKQGGANHGLDPEGFDKIINYIVEQNFSNVSYMEKRLLSYKEDSPYKIGQLFNNLIAGADGNDNFFISGQQQLKLDLSNVSEDDVNAFAFIIQNIPDAMSFGELKIEIDANVDVPVFPDFPNQPFPFIDQAQVDAWNTEYSGIIEYAMSEAGYDERLEGYGYDAFRDETGGPDEVAKPNPFSIWNDVISIIFKISSMNSYSGFDDANPDPMNQGYDLVSRRLKNAIVETLADHNLDTAGFGHTDLIEAEEEDGFQLIMDCQEMIEEHLSQDRKRIQMTGIDQSISIDLTSVILASFLSPGNQQRDILSILAAIHDNTASFVQDIVVKLVATGRRHGVTREIQQSIINDINNMIDPSDWYDICVNEIDAFAQNNPDSFYY